MSLSDQVRDLEQENERLQKLCDSLTEQLEAQQPAGRDARDYFIELIGPFMTPLIGHRDTITESMAELLRAYEKARR